MADRTTRILLEIMALDRASAVLKTMMDSLQGWADKMNGVSEQTQLSSEELEVAQVRLQGATDALEGALANQTAALGALEAAQAKVVEAQRAAVVAQDEGTKAAAEAATAVKLATDEQIAAYDKLMATDALVVKRTRQVADAQIAGAEESDTAGASLGKLAPALLAVGAATAYLGYKSVEAAANFQTSMTKLVTSAGESKDALTSVSQGVLNVSDQTGIAATDLAKALYYVDSAGYHAADSITILTAAAKGARDEQADTASVTNALTTVMTNYNMKASQSTLVMNQMITAVSLGKTNLQDFSVALAQVLPIAAASGVSFEQVGAALSAMTAKGMTAQQAAQDLAFSIRSMQNPNGVAITEMEQLGLTAAQVQKVLGTGPNGLANTFMLLSNTVTQHMGPAGNVITSAFNQSRSAAAKAKEMFDMLPASLKGLATQLENGTISANNWRLAIRNLSPDQQKLMQEFATLQTNAHGFSRLLTSNATPATQTYNAAMAKMMGGAAGLNTALMLVSGSGISQYTTNVQKMNAVTNQANKEVDGWSEVQGTFNQRLAEAKQTLINTGIAIGTALLPPLTAFMSAVVKFLTPMATWISHHQKLAAFILLTISALATLVGIILVVTKVVGLVSAAVKALGVALEFVADNPIVLAIAAVIAVLYLAIKYWKQIKEAVMDAWGWIKGHVQEVAAALTLLLGPFGALLAAALEIYTHWKQITTFLGEAWHAVAAAAKVAWHAIQDVLQSVWNWMLGAWNASGGKAVTAIEHAWDVVSASFKQEWDRISNDLSTIWSELVTIWNDTGGRIVTFISDNWDTIKTVTSAAWHVLFDPVRQAFDGVVGIVKGALRILTGVLRAGWDMVRAITGAEWDVIRGVVKAVWDVISGIVQGTIDFIVGIVKAWFDVVKGLFEVGWDTIKGIVNTALDFIKDILKVFIDLITGKWGQMWTDLKKTATDFANNIRTGFDAIINDVKNAVVNGAKDIWNGFIRGAEDALNGIWKALQDVYHAVVNAFKNAVTWLEHAGEDLINGLINGIENMGSALWNSLKNIGGGILGNITSFFGISSPSKVFHGIGVNLMQGLANGIAASGQNAVQAAHAAAKGVAAAATGATVGGISLSTRGGSSLYAGSLAASTRPAVYFTADLRGAQIAGPQSVQWITDQLNKKFVQVVVPTAGITVRRTGG